MILPTILFYVFSALTIAAAIGVISVKNPVYAVLFLIFAFFNAAGLFVLQGAELLAMLLVIVYVGAVAVLFLFVVMMLNINYARMKDGFLKMLPIGLTVAGVLLVEMYFMIKASVKSVPESGSNAIEGVTNTHAIGLVLYTEYVLLFQLSGLILLVAMIGAIVLTHRQREGVRKQKISEQLQRDPKESVEMVSIKPRSGI